MTLEDIPKANIYELADRFHTILLDAYGVIVHGSGAYPGAAELINHLNEQKKSYFVVTNGATKLPETSALHYRKKGLNIPAERVISSAGLLKNYFEKNDLVGATCKVLGPEESVEYVRLAGGRAVDLGEKVEADALIICNQSGYPFLETMDDIITWLVEAFDRDQTVHLILPNPDVIYPISQGKVGITAGAVAALIEQALATRFSHESKTRFTRLGKPYAPIFEEALRRSSTKDMIMVGDTLDTDILGGNNFGLKTAYITSGVASEAKLGSLSDPAMRPDYILKDLRR